MTLWKNSSKSWTVNHVNDTSLNESPSSSKSTWMKLKLLLWKNYIIQTRHKWQTLLEILLPLLFSIILVIIRIIIQSNNITEPTFYTPYSLDRNPPHGSMLRCDMLYYTPTNPVTDALMKRVQDDFFENEGFIYTFTGFNTEEEMLNAYSMASLAPNSTTLNEDTTTPVLAAIVFFGNFSSVSSDSGLPQNIEYQLRFPASLRGDFDVINEKTGLKASWFTEIVYPLFQLLGPRAKDKNDGGLPGYYTEGFLYLQYAIDRTLIRTIMESSPDELAKIEQQNIMLQRFPYPPYTDDKYLFALQAFLPLLMLLSFIYPIINITKSIVYEKEKRLKESMKMMGLSNWLHWTAWFIKAYGFLLVSCLLMTLLLKVRITANQSLPVVPYTDGTLIFFILVVFSFSAICFCFFVSSVFSRANPAATGAGAAWILFYVPFAFIQPRYNLLPFYVKIIFCILNNTPISFACQIICMFEGTGDGLQWETLNVGSSPDDNFSMVYALLMMVINGVVYLLGALYVESVWPGEYGIPLPKTYFLQKWYWMGTERQIAESSYEFNVPRSQFNPNIQPNEGNMKAGIEIKNLTKKFGKKTAVNGLNLVMNEGQITALLGHNGAGKTTTISILTGLFPPTSGTAVINGSDIHRDMPAIRSSLGICPQHDVLFDELTVAEHLRFFCLLKGMEKNEVESEITRLIASLGLESKRDAKSRTLSGGMKRKLSVLIALCADSKIVLLDECTSGMDLGSRRCTWDLIQKEKKNRTIILSTHFMEEADVLGDRIAIMADGELQCCGSSLFLKKRYGGGYHLIIVKNPDCVVENITNLLKKNIPEAEIDQNVGAELSYSLPDSKSHFFPAIFEELETKKDALGIASYGASITTMEEVFMKVLKDAEESKSQNNRDDLDLVKHTTVNVSNLESTKSDSYSKLFNKNEFTKNTGLTLLFQQFWAMLIKKLVYSYRNRKLVLVQMGIPVVHMILMYTCLHAFPGFHDPIPFDVSNLDRYENVGKTVTVVKCVNESGICDNYVDHVGQNYVVKQIENESNFSDYIIGLAQKSLTTVNVRYIVGLEERPNSKNSTDIIGYFNNQPFHTPPLALNFITNAILRNYNYTVKTSNFPLPYTAVDEFKDIGSILTVGFQLGYNVVLAMSFVTSTLVVFAVKERVSGCKHLQLVSGVRIVLFWLSSFIVDFVNYIIPCFGMLGIIILFRTKEFLTLEMQAYFMLTLSVAGFALIPFTYLCSFVATNPTTAYSRLVILKMFLGLAPIMTITLMSIPEFHLYHLVENLNSYFLILPNYALGMALIQISSNYQVRQVCPSVGLEFICEGNQDSENPFLQFCCKNMRENYLDWQRFGIGMNLVYLAALGCIYIVILFIIEFKIFNKIANLFRKTETVIQDSSSVSDMEDVIGLDDSDVLMEDEKIRKTNLNTLFKSHNVVVRDLTKLYGNFVAVDKINFGVQPGECFGLLGVNGAGKTTTFKQLTGDIPVSDGDAFICSHSVQKALRDVHANIGYTPQFDGLIDEMTCRETIWMFARLRGVPEKYINDLVQELGSLLLFSKHMDKQVCQLSGGNKRKLSTACALVGKPSVVLLDEPSSGMDPVARRHLWNAVSHVRDSGASIILTTHSLEEAENLCTRMAIMVNGRFRCLGPTQHLKNKFSKGYTLIAQTPAKMTNESEPFTRSMEEQGRRRSSVRSERSIRNGRNDSMRSERSSIKNGRTESVRNRKNTTTTHWEANLQDLREFIESAFPGCILKDIHPGFVHYHVIPSSETSWGKMFSTMEEARVKFKLEAYSVGQTSLEQVFLNFTKAQINNEDS